MKSRGGSSSIPSSTLHISYPLCMYACMYIFVYIYIYIYQGQLEQSAVRCRVVSRESSPTGSDMIIDTNFLFTFMCSLSPSFQSLYRPYPQIEPSLSTPLVVRHMESRFYRSYTQHGRAFYKLISAKIIIGLCICQPSM